MMGITEYVNSQSKYRERDCNTKDEIGNQAFQLFSFDDYYQASTKFSQLIIPMQNFFNSYNRLALDIYMNDQGKYRLRRFARFKYYPKSEKLIKLPNGSFYQAKKYNSLNGDIERLFAELEPEIAQNSFLNYLINFNFKHLPLTTYQRQQNWYVYTHQIRINANGLERSHPTPEGIHQDGHRYVAQIFIARENIGGGVSQLYDIKLKPLMSLTLCETLDTILLDDKKLFHGVTPVYSLDPHKPGMRDILLIDFNLCRDVDKRNKEGK